MLLPGVATKFPRSPTESPLATKRAEAILEGMISPAAGTRDVGRAVGARMVTAVGVERQAVIRLNGRRELDADATGVIGCTKSIYASSSAHSGPSPLSAASGPWVPVHHHVVSADNCACSACPASTTLPSETQSPHG